MGRVREGRGWGGHEGKRRKGKEKGKEGKSGRREENGKKVQGRNRKGKK